MKTSIVIPCYNEEKNISLIYDAIVNSFAKNKINYEIIFVNDGSSDESMKVLRELLKEKTNVKVVNFSRNFGKESAIYAGLKESSGEYVSIIDADMQQDPKLILDMVSFLEENTDYDSVAMCQEQRKESGVLIFFKKAFYRLINKFSDIDFVDGASDFRTLKRNMVNAILEMQEYYRFSKGIFSWVGFNTYYMKYKVNERANGETKWSFWKLFKYAIDGIIAFTTTPLRLATVIGIISSFGSIFYLLFVIIQKIFFGIVIPGYATLVSIMLLIGGLQLFSLGIIGEYLARTYVESKKRPIYIAKEVIKNYKK